MNYLGTEDRLEYLIIKKLKIRKINKFVMHATQIMF